MLPVELWRKIFRESVYIPGLFDTEWDPSLVQEEAKSELVWTGWPTIKEASSRSDVGLETRRSIVLVSRTWMEMGEEFLYECVTIQRREDLTTLLSVFEADIEARPRLQKGRWTKRVEVTTELRTTQDIWALRRFLTCCTNVRILSAPLRSSRGNPFHSLLPTIFHQFQNSLQRIPLTFEHVQAIEAQSEWLSAMPLSSLEIDIGSPGSRALPVAHPHPTTGFEAKLSSPFNLVTTLTLTLHAYTADAINWHLPRLQHLSLITTGFNNYSFLIPFLSTHADTLISLHIVSADVIGDLSEVLVSATNLQHLALDHVELKELLPSVALPNVKCLCVHVLPTRDSVSVFASTLKTILSADALPSLRRIQATGVQDREQSSHLANLRELCAGRQVQFHLGPVNPSYSIYSGFPA